MLFPTQERIIFQKNPLVEVTCAINFNPLLEIDTDLPLLLHQQIRRTYPLYQRAPVEDDLARVQHEFISSDACWRVVLTSETCLLSTTRYDRWEKFLEKWSQMESALQKSYSELDTYTKLQLRYIDVIDRSMLGLREIPWGDLLNPAIAGLLALDQTQQLEATEHSYVARLSPQCHLNLRHGLTRSRNNEDLLYFFDSLFTYTQELNAADGHHAFRELRQYTGSVFSFCLAEKLREALQPAPLPPALPSKR